MSARAIPSGVAPRIGSRTCWACASASSHDAGMYSSSTPSIDADTCHRCRNASDSARGMRSFHSVIWRLANVARLCQVTMMSAWLIGIGFCPPVSGQCGDWGSRCRTAACTSRVLTAVTTMSPLFS